MTESTAPQAERVTATASGFTIEFSLAELLHALDPEARYLGYDPEQDESHYEAGSLADLVVDATAEKLVKAFRRDVVTDVRQAVKDKVDEQIGEVVKDLLAGELQRTDGFGRAVGSPMTLADLIREQATDMLSKPMNDNTSWGSSGRGKTVVQKLVEEAVGAAFKAELKGVVDEAKSAAKAAIRASAAEVISETIERATRGL